jgi:peptide/nickel transport system substrate-binding protein
MADSNKPDVVTTGRRPAMGQWRRDTGPAIPGVRVVLAFVVAMMMLAAACGDDSADEAAPGSEGAAPGDAEEPRSGGHLEVAVLFDAFGLDPWTMVGSIADGTIGMAFYDPLMIYDEDNEVVPFLAESLETDDNQTWTLRLREGVEFHDGTPLDAEAVKFNLERHQDISVLSRSILNAINIEEIRVVDPLTAEIELQFPWPAFPETLVGNLGKIASPTAVEADPEAIETNPVGTGPFLLDEWARGERLVLRANPNYWREGEPYVDTVTLRPILDVQTRFESVRRGEIHIGQTTNGAELVDADEADEMQSFPIFGPGITIQFNTDAEPFDDPRVRLAVWHATNREAINDVVFKGAGVTPPYDSLIPRDSKFYIEEIDYPEFDPDRAAALVEEVEAERGPIEFTFKCINLPDQVQMAQLLEEMWGNVGMDAEIQIMDQNQVVLDVFERNYQSSCFGVIGNEDPDLQFHGALLSDSPINTTGYSNSQVDEALETGRRSSDPDERFEAYRTVQEHLATDAPLFVANSTPWGWFATSDVRGLSPIRNATFRLAEVWLSE